VIYTLYPTPTAYIPQVLSNVLALWLHSPWPVLSQLKCLLSPQGICISTLLAVFHLEGGWLAGPQPELICNFSVPNDTIIVEYAYINFCFSLGDEYRELSV